MMGRKDSRLSETGAHRCSWKQDEEGPLHPWVDPEDLDDAVL